MRQLAPLLGAGPARAAAAGWLVTHWLRDPPRAGRRLEGHLWTALGLDPGTAERARAVLAGIDAGLIEEVASLVPDPAVHFYPHLLGALEPGERGRLGAWTTPDELVQLVVHLADRSLVEELGAPLGLADPSPWRDRRAAPAGADPDSPWVRIFDPAVGTGAFLVAVAGRVLRTLRERWHAEGLPDVAAAERWRRYVAASLTPRLTGGEVDPAARVVALLRLAWALEGGLAAREGLDVDRWGADVDVAEIDVALGDTLARAPRTPLLTVILGNPPYGREPASGGSDPALADFLAPARAAGAGAHTKNLYNRYVRFWRWCAREVLERASVGFVGLVTPSSFLRGPGFVGMREHLRRHADRISVVDLGGDQRSATGGENLFDVQLPVCVTTASRGGAGWSGVRVVRVPGDRDDKRRWCAAAAAGKPVSWSPGPSAAQAPFVGVGAAPYHAWPALTDLLPWHRSGVKAGRTWVVGETRELVERRLAALGSASPEERRRLFKDSPTGRRLEDVATSLDVAPPDVRPYGARSFDRRWVVDDPAFLDRPASPLWEAHGPSQRYLTTALTEPIGPGPAATATAELPDLHHFCGRGGRDVIPLWRDRAGTIANVSVRALDVLGSGYGRVPTRTELFAYVLAVLAGTSYQRRFADELRVPGPRIPLTRDGSLFAEGAALGQQMLALHSLELPADVVATGDLVRLPARVWHGGDRLHLDGLVVEGVPAAVWEFRVSGRRVLPAWVRARSGAGSGRRSSPLDDLRPAGWTPALGEELGRVVSALTGVLRRDAELERWLGEVLGGELVTAAEVAAGRVEGQRANATSRS